MKRWLLLILCLGSMAVSAQGSVSVGTFIRVNEGFSTLTQALELSGLMATLEESGAVTLFAPTDQAFDALPTAKRESLFASPNAMRAFLSKLIVPQKLLSSDLTARGQVSALSGFLNFSISSNNRVLVNGRATITLSDVGTTGLLLSNGTIQVIDSLEGF